MSAPPYFPPFFGVHNIPFGAPTNAVPAAAHPVNTDLPNNQDNRQDDREVEGGPAESNAAEPDDGNVDTPPEGSQPPSKKMRKNGIPLFLDTEEKLRVAKVYVRLLIACNEKHKDQKGSGTRANQLGSGGVSCRLLAKEANVGKTTAAKIMKELKDHGGILDKKPVRHGAGSVKLSDLDKQVVGQLYYLEQTTGAGSSKAKKGSSLKKQRQVAIQWFQEELERRTGSKASSTTISQYVTTLAREHQEAVEKQRQHAESLLENTTLLTTAAASRTLLPTVGGGSVSTSPLAPFLHIPLPPPSLFVDGPKQAPLAPKDEDEDEDAEGSFVPGASATQPTKQKMENAKDLASSAFNALHHEEPEVAVERLKQALRELGH